MILEYEMDPSYIYFKQIKIDRDKSFTADFWFTFKNAANNLSIILNPSNDLINVESGLEEVENTLIDELFYTVKKIKEKIEEYKAIPIKHFINESYFLYDKSNLIKKTFITAINKQLSLYDFFSYFFGKNWHFKPKIVNFERFFKVSRRKKIFEVKLNITASANRRIRGKNIIF